MFSQVKEAFILAGGETCLSYFTSFPSTRNGRRGGSVFLSVLCIAVHLMNTARASTRITDFGGTTPLDADRPGFYESGSRPLQ